MPMHCASEVVQSLRSYVGLEEPEQVQAKMDVCVLKVDAAACHIVWTAALRIVASLNAAIVEHHAVHVAD